MSGHVFCFSDVRREGDRFMARGLVAEIVPDEKYPRMWRVRRPDGSLTDLVNRTRAAEAAKAILVAILNAEETGNGASPVRF